MKKVQNFLMFLFLSCQTVIQCVIADEDAFGFGAEDNEDNIVSIFSEREVGNAIEDSVMKATRQDPDDVELFLSPGPMMAPDIILKGFVDSRISLSAGGIYAKPENMNSDIGSNFIDSEQYALNDKNPLDLEPNLLENMLSNSIEDDEETHAKPPCFMNFNGAYGGFNLSFDSDCIIKISNPTEDSRLMLACSPIALGNCDTYKDSLAVNTMGDTSFKQNSFLYCGHDANIRAISFRNKLAIRVKKNDAVSGSTFCTYNSRHQRDTDGDSSSVPCGRLGRLAKIVGGRRVPPGLFPWAVQLDITRTDGTQTGCTGTIVSPYYVLTAAHCMKRAESVSAFMGGTDRLDIIGTEVLIQAEKYILHKKWSARTLVADIALVKLTQPIQYSEDVSPICLPEGRLLSEDMSGKRGVAIGWGRTETKKKAPRRLYRVKLPLLSDNSCRNIYRRFYIPKVMMCTDSKKDAAICYGMTRNELLTALIVTLVSFCTL